MNDEEGHLYGMAQAYIGRRIQMESSGYLFIIQTVEEKRTEGEANVVDKGKAWVNA